MSAGGRHREQAARTPGGDWLGLLRRYLAAILLGNLIWEVLQLPLYTIWQEATLPTLAFAVLHCTLGDVAIAAACLVLALISFGTVDWAREVRAYRRVAAVATAIGVAYLVYSEYVNVGAPGRWDYAPEMPRLPPFGTGLAPFLQWLLLPPLAFVHAWRRRDGRQQAQA